VGKFWIKASFTFVAIYLIAYLAPATRASFTYALVSTLLIVIPGWAGDRMVLPHLQNLVAALLDGVYSFAVLWIAALISPFTAVTFTYLILTALVIGVFEYLLHPTIFNPRHFKRKGARF
jgi:hypothetical protein